MHPLCYAVPSASMIIEYPILLFLSNDSMPIVVSIRKGIHRILQLQVIYFCRHIVLTLERPCQVGQTRLSRILLGSVTALSEIIEPVLES